MGIRRNGAARMRIAGGVLVAALIATSCSSLTVDVQNLTSDKLQGRNNATAGSAAAQRYLIGRLRAFAVGANPAAKGDDAFKQPFDGGNNVVALIRGKALPDEYVVIGAHYDHLGTSCRTARGGDPADQVCNGATDNASGVAAVLAIGAVIAQRDGGPRRSVVLALWDREEDGLLGSKYYVQHPLVPLAQTVAYVNFDIQGSNLLPSLRNTSFAVGAETGGATLVAMVQRAIGTTTLDTRLVSAIYGENRSDYASFISARVPTVFFGDSTGPCYHSAQDEIGVVDFRKLDAQAKIGARLAEQLVASYAPPTFATGTPVTTYDDALTLQAVAHRAIGDLGRFDATEQERLLQFRDDVDRIVADGRANFGNDDAGTLLAGAAASIDILTHGVCDGFIAD
jgi:Peptidase family M28